MDALIGFADALRRVFPTTVASYRISWPGPSGGLMRANVGKLGLRQQATGRTNCRLSPDDRPQPGSLDRAHRSGRAGGDHQNLATTLLLPRRMPYPLGAPPHFASATALALGEPVQSCPGTAATDSTPSLTTCLPLTRHPAHGTSPQLAPSSVREHLLLRTPLAIPPGATTAGRRHPLCAAAAPCTQPKSVGSSPHGLFHLPLIPSLTGMATSLRWIRV